MMRRLFLVLLLLIPCMVSEAKNAPQTNEQSEEAFLAQPEEEPFRYAEASGWQLKPGSGYGPIMLNQSQSEAEAALGPSVSAEPSQSDPEASLKTYKGNVLLLISGKKKVLGITTWAPNAKMASGLGMGSSITQIKSALGPGLQRGQRQVAYPSGIGFAYDDSGNVERVFVFKAEPQSALQGDRLIVGGKRCGDLKVGMTISEVESAWGTAPKKDGKNYSWPDKFVSVLVDNGQVLAITITTGDYITIKGLKAGSSKAEVLKIYGKAPDTTGGNLIYPKWGIAFYLAGDSVSTIQVFAPIK